MTLRDLGLDEQTERVYRAVLGLRGADVETLARELGVSTPELGERLDRLEALGLLRASGPVPVAASVGSAVGSLIERLEDDLMSHYRRVSATRSDLGALEALEATSMASAHLDAGGTEGTGDGPAPAEPPELERIEDLALIRERIEELAFFSRTSLHSVQPGGPQSHESLDASRPLDHRGLRRGIDMRILYQSAVLEDDYNRLYLQELVARGAKVRLTDGPLDRMVVLDGSVAVVPIDPADSYRGALVVRHPGLVNGFVDLFRRAWEEATDLSFLDPLETDAGEPISDEDRRVLALLAGGCTDETAAREIGVSVRHLRRRISRLMLELGASSRFEAGGEASRRGWI